MSDIVHNEQETRYELSVDGEIASIAEYTPSGDTWVFDHTETVPRFGGRGLAARVVGFALDDARKRGVKVVASCWYVAEFIDKHPEYAELVA